MKSILLIPIMLVCFSFQSLAQSPNAARASRATQNMDKVLKLSSEQKRSIEEAYLKMYQDLQQIQELPDQKEVAEKTKQTRINFNNTLTNTLTKEQMDKWIDINSKEGNPNLKVQKSSKLSDEQRTEIAAKNRAKRLTKQLDLSPEQEQSVFEAYFSKMTKTVALRPLAKKDPAAAKTERMKLNRGLDASIDSILTTAQKKKLTSDKEKIKAGKSKSNNGGKISRRYSMADKNTERAEALTKRTANTIYMTDEQKNAYRTAAAEKYRALDGLKIKSKGMSIEERTATQVKIDAEFEQKVKAILSKEQLEMLNKKTAN